MLKRAKPILFFTLAIATVAMLGYGQAWAEPQCQEVQIYRNEVMILWNPACTVLKGVYYWRGVPGDLGYNDQCDTSLFGVTCSPTNTSTCPPSDDPNAPQGTLCWREGELVKTVFCICEGSDCVDDANGGIQANIERMRSTDPVYDATVECSAITDIGPRLGCPMFINSSRTGAGGRCCFR